MKENGAWRKVEENGVWGVEKGGIVRGVEEGGEGGEGVWDGLVGAREGIIVEVAKRCTGE